MSDFRVTSKQNINDLRAGDFTVGSGLWYKKEHFNLVSKISDVICNFNQTQNFSSVEECLKYNFENKSDSNVRGKLFDTFNNLPQILQQQYEVFQYDDIFKLRNMKTLKLELKKLIEKELFPINTCSNYLKKIENWFKALLTKNGSQIINMLKKFSLDDLQLLFLAKISKQCGINMSQKRFQKLLKHFRNFFNNNNNQNQNTKYLIYIKIFLILFKIFINEYFLYFKRNSKSNELD